MRKTATNSAAAVVAIVLLLPLAAKAASVEDELRGIATATQRALPLNVSDDMQATTMTVAGKTVLARYHFTKKSAISNVESFRDELFRNTMNSSCTNPEIARLIKQGAYWKYEYYDVDNRFILGYAIDQGVCKNFR